MNLISFNKNLNPINLDISAKQCLFQELVPHTLIGITNVVHSLFRFQSTKSMVVCTSEALLGATRNGPRCTINECWGPKRPLLDFGHVVEVYWLCLQTKTVHQLLYSQANILTTLCSHLNISSYFWCSLLAMFVGQRLCINFFVSRANFLTTLCSHLDVTCSCYFWSNLLNVDVNYIYIHINIYSQLQLLP